MKCSVNNCNVAVRYKGLCGKHYKRQWRHGDPTKTLINMHEKGELCSVKDCSRFAKIEDLCHRHYTHKWRYGTPVGWKAEYGTGRKVVRQYNREDRRRTEKALGKSLPKGSIIHHHYGDPNTLVICPSQAYHMLLHKLQRTRVRGNSGFD